MKPMLLFAAVISMAFAVERYDGDQVLEIMPAHEGHLTKLMFLQMNDTRIDFWKGPASLSRPVGVRVPKEHLKEIKEMLKNNEMDYKVAVEDVQQLVDEQAASMNVTVGKSSPVGRYARVAEIHSWLDELADKYPDVVTKFEGGKSFQGRPLKGIKVGKSAPGKPALWFHAGIHAREWVAIASNIYIIDQLLSSTDPSVKALRENLVWYIIPVANPDGYEYTHTHKRMWRKTLQPHSYFCKGADPNRNWDAAWGTTGVSRNPCSDIYPGPKPWSEPETRTLSETISSLKDEIKGFISFHSFSQLWLTPWAYTTKYPEDHAELMAVANEATKRLMAVHNTYWKVGPPSHILYEASGGAYDWAKMKAGIKYAYTLECRPNRMNPGFMLPASGIIPSGEETWAGVKYVAEFLVKKYGK